MQCHSCRMRIFVSFTLLYDQILSVRLLTVLLFSVTAFHIHVFHFIFARFLRYFHIPALLDKQGLISYIVCKFIDIRF
jgi:hypothetical protein